MKLVDVPDSKSGVVHPTCRFDSGHRQIKKDAYVVSFFISNGQEENRLLPVREERAEAGADFGFVSFDTNAKMRNAVYCERLKTDSGHRHFYTRKGVFYWSRTSGSYLSKNDT